MSAYMSKYAVLSVKKDTYKLEFEVQYVNELSPKDLQHTTIVITKDENNDSVRYALNSLRPIWNYNNESKMLIDHEGGQLKTDSPLEILRVVNLFKNVNEAVNEHFNIDTDKSITKRKSTLMSSLSQNITAEANREIQELKLQNIGITQELTLQKNEITQELEGQQSTVRGKNIKIGIRDSKILKYEEALLGIKKIVRTEQSLSKKYSTSIKKLIDENRISRNLSSAIISVLEEKHLFVKERSIVTLITDSGVKENKEN